MILNINIPVKINIIVIFLSISNNMNIDYKFAIQFSMNIKNYTTIILASFLLFSCSLKENSKVHGLLNLEKRQELLKIGYTNQNDVIAEFGETLIKEYPKENLWAYIEVVEKRNIYGKKEILKNNVLILEFNSKGILINKEFLDNKNFQKIKFDNNQTKGLAIDERFSKKFLGSVRKRFENKVKSLEE
jgi:outer membrane protein assembly factor BamE (lipoprotein component of BamABCDE complex)